MSPITVGPVMVVMVMSLGLLRRLLRGLLAVAVALLVVAVALALLRQGLLDEVPGRELGVRHLVLVLLVQLVLRRLQLVVDFAPALAELLALLDRLLGLRRGLRRALHPIHSD